MTRRRLVWNIFPSYLVVTFAAVLAIGWYATLSIERFHSRQVETDLEARARLIKRQMSDTLKRREYDRLQQLCKELGSEASTRITVVLLGGKVVADSEEEPSDMENHADRPEIRSAFERGRGSSTRYSGTLGKNMMYVAIRVVERGRNAAVVRTSLPLTEVMAAAGRLYVKILVAGMVVAALAAVVSLVISRRIAKPLAEMKEVAQGFAEGDFTRRLPAQSSEELSGLAEAMNAMAAQLDERVRKVTEQRNELEALLSSMTEAVLAVDREERIIRLNDAAGRLFHVDPAQARDKSIQGIVRNSELQQVVAQVLSTGTQAEREMTLQNDEGETYLQVRGTRLWDSTGGSIGAVIVLNDVTRMKRLENVRREFVANVSHELRTPVTAIKGYVETLREGNVSDPDDARRFIDIVAKQADRLDAIIEDLLALSRIEESERKGVSREELRLRDILESALAACGAEASSRNVSLDVTCPEGLTVRVNGALLEQAVINLIDNAVKYSEPHGNVTVQAALDEGEVSIVVEDKGCGIPPEHLPRLFERFYRVDKARSRKLGGTGLGLAIVKHIVQAHDGTVSVESAPGKGSIFTLRFPRA